MWAGHGAAELSFQVVLAGNDAQLIHDANIKLPDAFLGDAELLADFLECHALGVVQAGPHANDLALARIEILQQPIDPVGILFRGGDHFMFVGAIIRSNVEEVFFACHVAFAAAFLLRDLHHPSLRAKKYDEARDLWQARVTKGWRFYFKIVGDVY